MIINGFEILEKIKKNNRIYFSGICKVCNNIFTMRHDSIKTSNSCGCWKTPNVSRRLQRIYNGMKTRCNNPNHVFYYRYGGNGINICNEWNSSSKTFYSWSLDNGYADNLSIDRIDNSLGYCPENCRWVPFINQQRNRTNNVVTEEIARKIQNEPPRISLDYLSEKYGLKKSTIKSIKYRQNWKM